jgi:hypothetical protein
VFDVEGDEREEQDVEHIPEIRRLGSLLHLEERKPNVPVSPAGLRSSLRLLTPVGHSTPLSSPTKCPTSVITPNPAFAPSPSLEWVVSEVGLVGVRREQLSGIERLRAGAGGSRNCFGGH